MTATLGWLVLFLPFFSFLLLALPLRRGKRVAGFVSIAGTAISFVLSLTIFAGFLGGSSASSAEVRFLEVGAVTFPFSIQIDALTALMLVVVTSVSLLVQIYSQEYLFEFKELDPGYERYYAYLSLFTTSMLGLVLSRNLLSLYVFWELVGLSSFLLVGFWFTRPAAAEAAKKAFITTRCGDFGFMLGLLALFAGAGTLDIPQLIAMVEANQINQTWLTLACLGIFAGAAGKSAQFPLHVWLPDAMEGPTPASALIHAATMVAAGVYLVARVFPLFEAAPTAMLVVAWIGGFTAFFAASIGLFQRDIKRILAYSTISQLGYMLLALGVGALGPAIFHLMTHAFFKALLFLGSGAVIFGTAYLDNHHHHQHGEQDITRMGGLRDKMKVTWVTFWMGALALAGVFPFAGSWSKDAILASVLQSGQYALYALGMVTVLLTAYYIARLMFMTFHGSWRGSDEQWNETKEPNWTMKAPLVILAVPTLIAGFWELGHLFADYMHNVPGVHAEEGINILNAAAATILALAGIGFAYLRYGKGQVHASDTNPTGVAALLANRYGLDTVFDGAINLVFLKGGALLREFDLRVIDGAVRGVAALSANTGDRLRRVETGRVQFYGLFLFAGVALIFGYAMFRSMAR